MQTAMRSSAWEAASWGYPNFCRASACPHFFMFNSDLTTRIWTTSGTALRVIAGQPSMTAGNSSAAAGRAA